MKLKEQFIQEYEELIQPKIISVAVMLPSGAIEVITNTEQIKSKALYYIEVYDDDFRLKRSPEVQIVGFMMV